MTIQTYRRITLICERTQIRADTIIRWSWTICTGSGREDRPLLGNGSTQGCLAAALQRIRHEHWYG